ncbi:type II toxin-antitoxin system YafQ family toxin [Viscerimonas tarda]
MYEIEYTNSFKKDYKRVLKRGYNVELLTKLFEQLMADGNVNPVYKPHKLLGNYAGYWECHIQSDWLLIWEIDEQNQCIILYYTGTHSDLF